ncbi:MAG: PhzF family phenazine biosynthesis protein [Chitinophagales bacterium]|nr:PhzF family phenazine biosynthesis protein [Chitinophagaceae bacterium]MBP9882848.1 PhzF family phenazine biosynthesis protein [Chitinophagales bacterium]
MKLKIFQVDAFTDHLFGGNPAAVCPLQEWLPAEKMQQIAMENNLSETAFFVPVDDGYELKWFTPVTEVKLCGHATLASGHVLYHHLGYVKPAIRFHSKSGLLGVEKNGEWLTLNFPTDHLNSVEVPELLRKGLYIEPAEVWKGFENYLVVLKSAEEVYQLKPDFRMLQQLDSLGVIVTARGNDVDFISRFFAPGAGIDEDPVTGSAHTSLTPYWAAKMNKTEFTARQVSTREGYLKCKLLGERVEISGKAVTYLEGEIAI